MDLARMIEALSDPSAYPRPHPAGAVEVRQTHISVVFLAGPHAYKVKKPLLLRFLDYSTPERHRDFCEQEVRLTAGWRFGLPGGRPRDLRRHACRDGGPRRCHRMGREDGAAARRRHARERLRRGEVGGGQIEGLARRIASFHTQAEAGASISAFGRLQVVARNARGNFEESESLVGTTISRAVFERLGALTETTLAALGPLIESRAGRGVLRDGHGDLRLDHVYLFPERPPPANLAIVDCIEFDERFRCADPIADMACLAMDLALHGRGDLARAFAEAFIGASGDSEGRELLPFYTAYRAAVRGKVEGLMLGEAEIPQPDRDAALIKARARWLLALGSLEEAGRRPCLVLVGGLPGTGKSTLSRALSERAGFTVIRSDLVRKDLAQASAEKSASSFFEGGIYCATGRGGPMRNASARPNRCCSRGSGPWWTRASARRRVAATSWRRRSGGASRPSCSSAGPGRPRCGSGSRAVAARLPTPIGRSIERPPINGRSQLASPTPPPGRLPTTGRRSVRSPTPLLPSAIWDSTTREAGMPARTAIRSPESSVIRSGAWLLAHPPRAGTHSPSLIRPSQGHPSRPASTGGGPYAYRKMQSSI